MLGNRYVSWIQHTDNVFIIRFQTFLSRSHILTFFLIFISTFLIYAFVVQELRYAAFPPTTLSSDRHRVVAVSMALVCLCFNCSVARDNRPKFPRHATRRDVLIITRRTSVRLRTTPGQNTTRQAIYERWIEGIQPLTTDLTGNRSAVVFDERTSISERKIHSHRSGSLHSLQGRHQCRVHWYRLTFAETVPSGINGDPASLG